ncbi:carboxypeptidase regulatory-like domain-containing protein [Archangium violaceum]|uniref:carboxypeptidase regulatory-like domain-containing protein n=1 Tax=Archangium violaceum TaxID=83451 RepID=UPI0036D90AB3
MRHPWWAGTMLGVGLLVAAFAGWHHSAMPHDVQAEATTPPPVSSAGSVAVPLAVTTAPPREVLSIRGTVRGARGPVAGATVLASRTVEGESLTGLPCVEGLGRMRGDYSTGDCVTSQRAEVLVAQRQGEAPVLAQALSTQDGAFFLDGLEAGSYSLWVESPEGVGLLRDVAVGQEGVEVVLGAGSRLSGSVTDEQRMPVEGARVIAVFTAHSRFFETLTDAQGRYFLGPLPRGEYVLVASHQDTMSRASALRLHPPDVRQSLTLIAPRTLVGRVLNPEGEPVAGAEVSLGRMDERRVLTDERGHFSFEGLTTLFYQVTAHHGGLMGTERVSFYSSQEDGTPSPLSKELTVELGTALAALEGVVRDERGQPVADAVIRLYAGRGCSVSSYLAKTDAQGVYRLGPLPPTKVSLSVSSPDGRLFAAHQETLSAGTRTLDLTLEFVPRVEGILVDARGQPVEGEHLSLRTRPGESAWSLSEKSGPGGRFSLRAFRPGPLLLRVGPDSDDEPSNQGVWSQEVPVPAADLRVVISRRPTVEGELVDEAGQPVAQALVSLWSSEASSDLELESGTTDARGRFSLIAPRPGRYRVSAELEDNSFAHATARAVEVGPEGAQVRLRFEAGHSLSGIVVDLQGRPVPEAVVGFQSEHRSGRHFRQEPEVHATTGPDGRFTFASVSGDPVVLSVETEDFLLAEPSREDMPGWMRLEPSAREVRVVLARKAMLRARLVRADGSTVTGFTVNGEEMYDEQGLLEWPIVRTGSLSLEISIDEDERSAAVKRTVFVRQEVDQDLGVITLRE